MAEEAAPGFWNVAKQVEETKKTVEGLAAIAEALQKAGRSAVCTIVNNTDVELVRIGSETVHGAFATAPPTIIRPRSGAAFGVQSGEFSIMTGTAGWVRYAGGGMILRCGWEVPWLGTNGAETTWTREDGREDMTGRYRTWETASGGNKKVPMDFVVTLIHEQPAWRYCRHCGLLFYDGYDKKGVCTKPLPTTRFDPGKADPQLYFKADPQLYLKPKVWESVFEPGVSLTRDGSGPPPPAGPAPVKKRGHEAAGFVFRLCHSFPALPHQQAGWRFCVKCQALFFDGFENDKGLCSGGGGHHWNASELPPWSRHFLLNHPS